MGTEVEIVPIPDTFASGIGAVEKLTDGLLRVYLYATQGSECGRGRPERVLVAKIVIPAAALASLAVKAGFALADQAQEIAALMN